MNLSRQHFMNRAFLAVPFGLWLGGLAACTSAPVRVKAPPSAVPIPATAVNPAEHKEPPVDPKAAELQRQQQARERQLHQDWPNLARYREANAQAGLPAEGENRVVFMGDSITDLWIRKAPEFFTGKPYLDRGISGQTTPQMLLRFRQDVVDLHPKVVVLLAGTNDIAGNTGPATSKMIEDNLQSMVELAQASGISPCLGLGPTRRQIRLEAGPGARSENRRPQRLDQGLRRPAPPRVSGLLFCHGR